MASQGESNGTQDDNNNSPNINTPMQDGPDHVPAPPTGTLVDSTPWIIEKWRLDIRPPSKANDATRTTMTHSNTMKTVDGGKAYRLFIKNAMSSIPDIRFYCLDQEMFVDKTTTATQEEHLHSFFNSSIGLREHGIRKFYMEILVGYHSISFNDIRTRLLSFVQSTETWLAQQSFPSLDIQGAGFFSLRHPQWTDIKVFEWNVKRGIKQYIKDLDTTTLSPEQRNSLETILADNTIPPFEVHVQRDIRAYYSVPPTHNPENHMQQKPSSPFHQKKAFLVTEALELRCKRKYTALFSTILEGIADANLWCLG